MRAQFVPPSPAPLFRSQTLNTLLIPTLIMSLAGAAPQGSLANLEAVELRYSGTLERHSRRGQDALPEKKFDIYVLIEPQGEGHTCFYAVTERGGGAWAWPERYGQMSLNDTNKRVEGRPIHILHTHDGTKYPIELAAPLNRFAGKIGITESWVSGKLKYSVHSNQKIGKRVCAHISGVDNFGRRENTYIEKDGSLVVAADRRVFMGRGDEFDLKFQLATVRALSGKAKEKTLQAAAGLMEVQKTLDRKEGETKPELTTKQLSDISGLLKSLNIDAKETSLADFVVGVSRDVKAQTDRVGDVASLINKVVGKPAPKFSLPTLKRKTVSNKTQENRITVLHFWDYKREPLEEPYGQVGYLDYLSNRRSKNGVDVVGVAVNKDFANPERKGKATASVRGIREFMNLSYTLATDDGTVLKAFGDPRSLDAKLPVWVIIGPDGKVSHYHAGFYSIKPDEGLKELDAEVVKMIRKLRAK
jgi:peroxiredoxin